MTKVLRVVSALIIISAVFFSAAGAALAIKDGKLVGRWKLITRPLDAAGNPCQFIPDEMEFYKDETVAMSNMPGNKMPYKIDLTAEEKKKIHERSPELKGRQLLLIKPSPQMEWETTPMIYGYFLSKSGMDLILPGWSPAKFKKLK